MSTRKYQKHDLIKAHLVVAAVSLEFGITHTEIYGRTKGVSRVSFARQVAMYLLHCVYAINLSRVGRAFDRDRSTASHACHVIEDGREDPVLDAKIRRLETFLNMAPLAAVSDVEA